mgnify:CR=1 FL=1
MSNDNGLIDLYEELQKKKKELEEQEQELKNKIIELSKEKKAPILFGKNKKCSIKEYIKVIYPEDKVSFVELIKNKGLYVKFSSLNYLKLKTPIIKGELDKEILELTKQEKAFRLSLKDI